MDWIKVKTQHVLYEGFTPRIGWAWIKVMALTAQIEKMPTQQQIEQLVGINVSSMLHQHFIDRRSSVDQVLIKVLKDADDVIQKRNNWKQYKAQQREKSRNVHMEVQRDSTPKIREEKRREDKIRIKEMDSSSPEPEPDPEIIPKKHFLVPTLDEVRAYCQERQNGIDPQSFIDFYSAKGWFVGKNKMKDWKAAVRNWENRRREENVKGVVRNGYTNGINPAEYQSLIEGRE